MSGRKIAIVAALSIALGSLVGGDVASARGGAARPGGAALPGGGAGGASLDGRRARTKRLNELGSNPTAAPTPPPTPVRPTPPAAPVPQQPVAAPGMTLVHLHHGSVRMAAGLARVDLTLEVQNVGPATMEWQRTYAIDPAAEIIGAVLIRTNEEPIRARTLTDMDARRIYAQIRTPPPSRRRTPRNRDPLLLSRPQNDRLVVQIWPIAPQETIRVALTFVTPLRGNGALRTYRDVMGGPPKSNGPTRLSRPEAPTRRPAPPAVTVNDELSSKADWLLNPGGLVLSAAGATGMEYGGQAAGLLHFTGVAATQPNTPAPSVSFLTPSKKHVAHLIGSGTRMGRIATWRFDPRAFLASEGYAVTAGVVVRLAPVKASCRRLAPAFFQPGDEPRPITAVLVKRDAAELAYVIEVVDRDGAVIERYPQSVPIARKTLAKELEAAVSGWHRAALVRRVFRWAGPDAAQRQQALRYAVDMGVLVAGSSALAVPQSERRRLSQRNRRLYDSDGVPLGAARHEADLKAPPRGSLDNASED